ncbi:MAG: hypothetical protein ACI9F9_000964 [Candidatus Paceibacteria bacterium]
MAMPTAMPRMEKIVRAGRCNKLRRASVIESPMRLNVKLGENFVHLFHWNARTRQRGFRREFTVYQE